MTKASKANSLNISAIDSSSLVDKVEMTLIDLLISKKLNPGDLIPKEMELVDMLGVSRTVVRESLNRLKTLGLIETKKHKGSIIKSPNLLLLFKKSIIPNILNEETLRNIFELRLVIEIGMADFIFERIKPEDLDELYEIVHLEPEKPDNVIFDVEHEIRFHGKLYSISGNNTLMEFQSMLLPAFHHVYASELIDTPTHSSRWVSHKDMVDILKNGTPNKFRMGMRKHLDGHFKSYFKNK